MFAEIQFGKMVADASAAGGSPPSPDLRSSFGSSGKIRVERGAFRAVLGEIFWIRRSGRW
jgi:hypothetical protein